MKLDTMCQFCNLYEGHKATCPLLKAIDRNNTFIPSITEKQVNAEIRALQENSEEIAKFKWVIHEIHGEGRRHVRGVGKKAARK